MLLSARQALNFFSPLVRITKFQQKLLENITILHQVRIILGMMNRISLNHRLAIFVLLYKLALSGNIRDDALLKSTWWCRPQGPHIAESFSFLPGGALPTIYQSSRYGEGPGFIQEENKHKRNSTNYYNFVTVCCCKVRYLGFILPLRFEITKLYNVFKKELDKVHLARHLMKNIVLYAVLHLEGVPPPSIHTTG